LYSSWSSRARGKQGRISGFQGFDTAAEYYAQGLHSGLA